jgi:hypothetical protein
MVFKKGDILSFHYGGIIYPDCVVDAEEHGFVYLTNTFDNRFIRYSRSYLISEIAANRIRFKRYGDPFSQKFLLKRFVL